jgi:RNA polymerase-binding transcription factor DksA
VDESAVRDVLRAEQEATLAHIAAVAQEFEAMVAASADTNADDEHDPEGSTIAFERAQLAAVLAQARTALDDINRALGRLADGTYPLCEKCGASISSERVAARPAARTCIRCATSRRP